MLTEKFNQDIQKIIASEDTNKGKITASQNASLDFQIKAGQLVRRYQIKAKSNESFTPLFINILMLLSGLGTIPAIISMIFKAATGKYLLFDKPIIRERSQNDMLPEDKLLGKPSNKA